MRGAGIPGVFLPVTGRGRPGVAGSDGGADWTSADFFTTDFTDIQDFADSRPVSRSVYLRALLPVILPIRVIQKMVKSVVKKAAAC
jgi:hypothetical protein